MNPVMKTFLLSAMLFTVTLSGMTQSWDVKFSGAYMRSISFPDSSTGYIAGDNGKIYKTIDAGNNWTEQVSNTPNTLESVCFTSSNIGYVAGNNKIILKTTDGGQTWVTQTSSSSGCFNSLVFPSTSVGYAVGEQGVICKTNDHGVTWNPQTSGTTKFLLSVYFLDVSNGYAAGEAGTILKTNNGGITWTPQTSGTTQDLRSVFFVSPSTGWVVGGNGLILKTVNSGLTWVQQTSGFSDVVHSVFFTSPSVGYVLGNSAVLKTTDAGATWTNQSVYTPGYSLTGTSGCFAFPSSATGFVICGSALLKTTNAGTNWNDNGMLYTYYSVAFADPLTGYCTGENGMIRKTINGGNSWTKLPTTDPYVLNHICCIGPDICYVVGNNGRILKTINGGTTWTEQVSGTTTSLNSVYFVSSTTGYIAAMDGSIYSTINGTYWIRQHPSVPTPPLLSVFFIDAYTGYVCGLSGTILKTTDGGTTWNFLNTGVSADFENIFFTDQNTGYACSSGNGGMVVKTTNGGSTWVIQTNGGLGSPNTLFFTDSLIGYMAGYDGAIHMTPDGGVTWTGMYSDSTNFLNSVFFMNSTNGWAVGSFGTLLKLHCNSVPSPAQGITGDHTICQGQSNVTYTTPVIAGADSYVWSLPPGATGASSTHSIAVNFGTSASPGNITVSGNNSCGAGPSSSLAITIGPLPANAGAISGATTVCQGPESSEYSVPLIENATSYTWTLPAGVTGSSSTNSILVHFSQSAITGNITASGHDSCGDGAASALHILVIPQPATPLITFNGTTLHSSSLYGNQWYNQTGLLLHATDPDYTPVVLGDYYSIVTLSNCSSDTSNVISVTSFGTGQIDPVKSIQVYPNPATDEITFEFTGNRGIMDFEIYNSTGQSVAQGHLLEKTAVQTNRYHPGLYLIRFRNARTAGYKTFIKE